MLYAFRQGEQRNVTALSSKSLMFKVTELDTRNGRYHTLGSLISQLLGGYFNAVISLEVLSGLILLKK